MADTTISSIETVSPETLGQLYVSNPFKAKKTYLGKTIEIRGKVHELTSDSGKPFVDFYCSSNGKSLHIRCFVSENDSLLADVEAGGNVTIQGHVSEIDTQFQFKAYDLKDCKIISVN